MIGVGLALLLACAPGPGPGSTQVEPAKEEPSKEEREAWDAAGWGSPTPEPEPESETTQGEDPDTSAWGAAGWGEPATAEPEAGPSEDWSAWDSSASATDEPAGDEAKRDRVKVGDILTGSLRLTGSYLHFYDQPQLPFTIPDDALGLAVARVLVEADLGERVHLSFNGFGELSRVPAFGASGGLFASAGATASAYRTDYLRFGFWRPDARIGETVGGQIGVDRAVLRINVDSVNIDIGRFPVTYTVASMFTINDFFTPFAANAVNRIYKPGVDGARLSFGLGPTASFDMVGVLGYAEPPDPNTIPLEERDRPTAGYNGAPTWARSAVFFHASVVAGGFEWAGLGGKLSGRWVGGGSLQGDAGPVNLRAEFHVGFPDAKGDGHGPDDRPIYGRVSGGPSVSFAWKNASIAAEYMFASDGAERPSGYVERAQAAFSDDLPYLGRHYIGVAGGSEIIPILRWGLTGLINVADGSGLAGVSLIYNVADESDLILGVFVPWGRPVTYYDIPTQTLELGSEFGFGAVIAYLEARVFF